MAVAVGTVQCSGSGRAGRGPDGGHGKKTISSSRACSAYGG